MLPQPQTQPSRQERFRADYARRRPGWRDSLSLYRELVRASVKANAAVLDLGCGHVDWMALELGQARMAVGADADLAALRRNRSLQHRVAADAARLPFATSSFDLVVSAFLLEHLDRPDAVAAELHRILKHGGQVVFLTPNALNYNVWLIRLVPHRFHSFLVRRLYAREEGDTYPTRYRINTPRTVERTLTAAGFTRRSQRTNCDPTYIAFNRFLFELGCGLEQLLNLGWLRRTQVHILGVYQKPEL